MSFSMGPVDLPAAVDRERMTRGFLSTGVGAAAGRPESFPVWDVIAATSPPEGDSGRASPAARLGPFAEKPLTSDTN
jgi:hypothetical protein